MWGPRAPCSEYRFCEFCPINVNIVLNKINIEACNVGLKKLLTVFFARFPPYITNLVSSLHKPNNAHICFNIVIN